MDDAVIEADPTFDRLAALIRTLLNAPVGLVTLVEPDRQVFPGAVGLPEPWQSQRFTPLTHSFCQYVVTDREPIIIADARREPRLRGNLAITELDVIAYAGFPLKDADDRVIGSVCAIDSTPRDWTIHELRMLGELAEVCTAEMKLRRTRVRLAESRRRPELFAALARSLAAAETVEAVEQAVRDVLGGYFGGATIGPAGAAPSDDPATVHLALTDRGRALATLTVTLPERPADDTEDGTDAGADDRADLDAIAVFVAQALAAAGR